MSFSGIVLGAVVLDVLAGALGFEAAGFGVAGLVSGRSFGVLPGSAGFAGTLLDVGLSGSSLVDCFLVVCSGFFGSGFFTTAPPRRSSRAGRFLPEPISCGTSEALSSSIHPATCCRTFLVSW